MAPDDNNQLERIFHEALERNTLSERTAYLDGACGADLHLRSRVDVLLQANEEANEFLEEAAIRPEQAALTEGPGTTIDQFKLLQQIGEGGMGVVYMAEQERPVRRKVALKIIKMGMDTKQVIARFEVERQALAMMDHPNIAKVLGAGATETGRPYFVMELVRGVSINEYCDTHKLSTRERLDLFIDTCHAIQHAHQKGIIHRDIKPSNVLVTAHDGRPVPKIIDFGVAKATNQRLTEMTLFTEFSQFIGTPEYMSPEQAEMSGLDIDTRTDVYSLGVLLYHLLTGTTPVDARTLRDAGYGGMQQLIREKEATTPSTLISNMGEQSTDVAKFRATSPGALRSMLRGDLDWIVMKSLEKDRTRRYETAAAMADDIRRHLDDLPVHAGPPSALYKMSKFVRRNRVPVLAASVAGIAILIGLAAALTGFWRARATAQHSQLISDTLQELLVSVDPGRAASSEVDVENLLARAKAAFGDEHATVAATVNNLAIQLHNAGDLRGAEPLYHEALRIWGKIHGDDHLNIALTLGHLGELQSLQGDLDRAESSLRGSLRIFDKLPDAPPLASCTISLELAKILDRRGEREEATQLFREVIRAYEVDRDANRYLLIQTREQFMLVLMAGNENEEALSVVRAIYHDVRRNYDDVSIFHMSSALGLANMLNQSGARDEAIQYYREALDYLNASSDPNTMYRVIALDRLFQILRHRTDPEYAAEADALLAECISALGNSWSATETVTNIDHLAGRYRGRRMWAEALAPGLQAVQFAQDQGLEPPIASRLRDKVTRDLVYILIDAEQGPHAYENALAVTEELLLDRPGDAAYTTILAGLLYRLGQTEDARDLNATVDAGPLDDSEPFTSIEPVKAAFEALIAHRLGDPDSAASALGRMTASERQFAALGMNHLDPLQAEVRAILDR
ncbi:MAG: serine/threonine protein kinase [Chlamydiales bacterium]|jgi:serine/threonine protein kinase